MWARGEEWESKMQLCTAAENATPGAGAARAPRTVALLCFLSKPCSAAPNQLPNCCENSEIPSLCEFILYQAQHTQPRGGTAPAAAQMTQTEPARNASAN